MRRIALTFARAVTALTNRLGAALVWLAALMVVLGAGNALLRYAGRYIGRNLSSNGALEAQWYLFAASFLLTGGYVLNHDGHVRVDVFREKLSARAIWLIEIIGLVLLVLPFCVIVVWAAAGPVATSWRIHEMSPDPGGLPRMWVKSLVPLGAVLLGLQTLARAVELALVGPGALAPPALEAPPVAPEAVR
jgi:TRAP-type mannitol/chloroaromatic compound transport system permease small subunit